VELISGPLQPSPGCAGAGESRSEGNEQLAIAFGRQQSALSSHTTSGVYHGHLVRRRNLAPPNLAKDKYCAWSFRTNE
jgi:hypothetical protein